MHNSTGAEVYKILYQDSVIISYTYVNDSNFQLNSRTTYI